ncbi:MAG TPA: transglutaminase-like domain-containing protein [Anaerolineae bacterium]|nr:transglutaminase-like domain-containing protein [Anaerolineae bacterium]
MSFISFRDIIQEENIDVPLASLLYARNIAYPDLNVDAYLHQLHLLSDQARQTVLPDTPVTKQSDDLARFLFNDQAFTGDKAAFADPRSSFLNDVLDNRRGIPITLSLIYLTLAEQLGIPAQGIGLPGHFIVAVFDGVRIIYRDPYNDGQTLTLEDCENLVRKTTGYDGRFLEDWLIPVTPQLILARMLNNLRITYAQMNRWEDTIAATEHLRLLQPDVTEYLRDLAIAHYNSGRLHRAAEFMEAYLQQTPDAPDAPMIRRMSSEIMARWARLN